MRTLPFVVPVVLTLSGAASAQTLIARINSGGPAFVDSIGQAWSADQAYVAGVQNGFVGGSTLGILSTFNGRLLGGQDNPSKPIYADSRINWSAYRFDVANGDYIVRLTLAEPWNQGPGLRSMDVGLEGAPFLVDEDLAARLGVQYGGQAAALVHVADGRLDVTAAPGPGVDPAIDAPIVSGIEVWRAPTSFPTPPAVHDLVARPGYAANFLAWDWETAPTLAGWRVWRAEVPAGRPVVEATSPGLSWTPLADLWAAPPRYHDRTAVPGRKYAYRVAALGLDGRMGVRAIDTATALDGEDTALPRYRLTVAPADQLFIDANIQANPDDEVPATFTWNGVPRPAETRYRGNSARFHSKKSWTIKFSSAEAFQGRRDLNLKASFLDTGLSRDYLAHSLFDALGQASPVIRAVHLEVNGVFMGVFNEAEEIDEGFLAARDRATTGDIFKCDSNMKVLPSLVNYQLLYEKKTNESTGHDALIAFIEFVNGGPSPTFRAELANQFDLESYLNYLAVIAYIGDGDSVRHNFYLHQDLTLDRWELVPWDNDLSFALGANQLFAPVLYGTSAVPGSPVNELRERVLTDPALLWRFCQKLREMEALYANPTWLNERVDEAYAERQPEAYADPFKFGWETELAFEADIPVLRGFAAARNPLVDAELDLIEPASPPTTIWINELAADAQTLVSDEAAEFEDWVELHNAGPGTVDLGGMSLTDDLSNPTKWVLPPGTLVGAGGHVLVWCDAEAGDGPLHAAFKLSASGEELGLFAADGVTLLDFVSWNRQYPELSFGRKHDAGPFFGLLATPTPGAANTAAGNLPPRLTWVSATPAVPDASEPVTISCFSKDPDGLAAVELHWQANGGGFATIVMAPEGADRFVGTVPAQPDGTQVDYYVTSTDGNGATSSKPPEGAADPFVYVVENAPTPSVIRINELLASNASTNQDEAGDFEDWIELRNTANVPVDLSGMFMSDDASNSTKWQVPPGTVIAANGTLLVWADDEAAEGPLHAAFKLGAGGEDAALFDTLANGNGLLASLPFGPQTADVSYGLLPDAGAHAYLLSTPSPNAANLPAAGSARVYEHSTSAANPVALAPAGAVAIGGALSLSVSNGTPSSPGLLLLALAPDDAAAGSGFALVTSPPAATVAFGTNGSGAASVAFPLPNDPGLVGLVLYSQVTVAGQLSNGVVARVGP